MKHAMKELQKIKNKKAKKKVETKPKKHAGKIIEDVNRLIQLLQVHQVELEHQNQELRITQQELEISRNKYVNLFDFSPIPYFTLDMDGIIKEVNLSASKMIGIDRNKLVGKRFMSYIPLTERDIYDSFIKTVFTYSVKHSCELKVINKDKHLFHIRLEGLEVIDILESDRKCQVALIELTK